MRNEPEPDTVSEPAADKMEAAELYELPRARTGAGWRLDRAAAVLAFVLLLFFASRAVVLTLIRSAAEISVSASTGVRAQIRDVKIDLLAGEFRLLGVTLANPPGFTGEKLATIPAIELDVNFWAFLAGRMHIKKAVVRIDDIWVERTGDGRINLQAVASRSGKKDSRSRPAGKKAAARVDRAEFSLDQIVYTESGRNPPFIRNYRVRMNSSLENVTDPYNVTKQIAEAVLDRALKSAVTAQAGKMMNKISGGVRSLFQ